ncbi:QacE family quaternary ammonium compound efflux SMR transporter [Paenibacillaceae bacterium]|nr:QacE family quaternary ammonium compound efflux SMR transporter [Paenibacillaceae bacterium]
MLVAYTCLFMAIILEVFGSSMLKLSNGFTKAAPIAGVVLGYGAAFYLLSLALNDLPLSLSYATWSGLGTILTVLAGVYVFKEKINRQMIVGLIILIIGIVMLNLEK